MGSVACLLNTSELGGAERSFITQLGILKKTEQFDLFYPVINQKRLTSELMTFITENDLNDPKEFHYEESLYSVSRSSKRTNFISVFVGFLNQILTTKLEGFFSYKTLWCNGNKVFFPLFISALIFGYEGRILWHLRDYPSGKKLNNLIRFLYRRFAKFNLVLVGNSNSVVNSYSRIFDLEKVIRAYNPVISRGPKKVSSSVHGVIGFAGMSAPWKGLHELYLWSSLYEEELKSLGVAEIAIFGKNIYLTKGEHSEYEKQLSRLKSEFPSSLVKRKGLVSPNEIYSSIDIMLHLSTRAEPFGRVLLESFEQGVPCISTALGGAAELMQENLELIHFKNDFGGLFELVKKIYQNKSFKEEQISKGDKSFRKFQDLAYRDLRCMETLYF